MNVEEHLLTCLTEECLEIGINACKSNRFGISDSKDERTLPNHKLITLEIYDLLGVIELLKERRIINTDDEEAKIHIEAKKSKSAKIYGVFKRARKVT